MLFRSTFIASFVSLTLLGSAGMHAVSEWLGTCSHHHHVTGHVHKHDCSHGHHHHHHAHHASDHSEKCPAHSDSEHKQHSHDSEHKQHSHDSEHKQHSHDSENCAVCIHYSLLAKPTAYVELPVLVDVVTHAPLPAYEGLAVTFINTFDRRGPPAVA